MQIESDYSYNLKDGITKISQNEFDLIFLDVNLPDGNGINTIPAILEKEFAPLVIIMTAYSNPDGAELAIDSGAWDYLKKPISLKELKLQILRALQFQKQKKQVTNIIRFKAENIIGESTSIKKCLTQASQIVSRDDNVLITGETGTGAQKDRKLMNHGPNEVRPDQVIPFDEGDDLKISNLLNLPAQGGVLPCAS